MSSKNKLVEPKKENGYTKKAKARDEMNVTAGIQRFGIGRGNTFFFTLTFSDNVTSKEEASAMWNIMLTAIRKVFPFFLFFGVWERQKRGAWHGHFVCYNPLVSMNRFNKFIRLFSSASARPYGFSKATWTTGKDANGLSHYMSKYISVEYREKGIRYVSMSRNWPRTCKMPFAWVGGRSEIWRKRCSDICASTGDIFRTIYSNLNYNDLLHAITRKTVEDSVNFLRCIFIDDPSFIGNRWRREVEKQSYTVTRTYTEYIPIYRDRKIISAYEIPHKEKVVCYA